MKVKVGDRTYDSQEEPVMVTLTEQDKKNISNMLPSATRYCMYPSDEWTAKEILEWMTEIGE